jgi:hypothetical protein
MAQYIHATVRIFVNPSLLLELEYSHPQGTSEIYKENVTTVAPLAAGFSPSHLSTPISALAAQDNAGSE